MENKRIRVTVTMAPSTKKLIKRKPFEPFSYALERFIIHHSSLEKARKGLMS